jgi:hypothetical protein
VQEDISGRPLATLWMRERSGHDLSESSIPPPLSEEVALDDFEEALPPLGAKNRLDRSEAATAAAPSTRATEPTTPPVVMAPPKSFARRPTVAIAALLLGALAGIALGAWWLAGRPMTFAALQESSSWGNESTTTQPAPAVAPSANVPPSTPSTGAQTALSDTAPPEPSADTSAAEPSALPPPVASIAPATAKPAGPVKAWPKPGKLPASGVKQAPAPAPAEPTTPQLKKPKF